MGILPGGEHHLIGEHRLQGGGQGLRLRPQALPGRGGAQAGDGAHRARRRLVHRLKLGAGVDAELIRLFLPAGAGQGGLDLQRAAGDLHPGEPRPLAVPGDLEHPGGEVGAVLGPGGIVLQPLEKLRHPLQLQSRAEPAGEELPLGDQGGEGAVVQGPVLQVALQRVLVADGGLLLYLLRRGGKVHAPLVQTAFQFGEQGVPVRPGQIHLVDKEKGGHPVPLQQLPQGVGVALHPVGAADDQNGAVQHLEGALHLGGEVGVAGGVQQGELRPLQGENGLLGEDGDPPLPLHGVGVQKGVLVIHPPQLFQPPAGVEQPLGQGGLARVHVGQDADYQFVHVSQSFALECTIRSSIACTVCAGQIISDRRPACAAGDHRPPLRIITTTAKVFQWHGTDGGPAGQAGTA